MSVVCVWCCVLGDRRCEPPFSSLRREHVILLTPRLGNSWKKISLDSVLSGASAAGPVPAVPVPSQTPARGRSGRLACATSSPPIRRAREHVLGKGAGCSYSVWQRAHGWRVAVERTWCTRHPLPGPARLLPPRRNPRYPTSPRRTPSIGTPCAAAASPQAASAAPELPYGASPRFLSPHPDTCSLSVRSYLLWARRSRSCTPENTR